MGIITLNFNLFGILMLAIGFVIISFIFRLVEAQIDINNEESNEEGRNGEQ